MSGAHAVKSFRFCFSAQPQAYTGSATPTATGTHTSHDTDTSVITVIYIDRGSTECNGPVGLAESRFSYVMLCYLSTECTL